MAAKRKTLLRPMDMAWQAFQAGIAYSQNLLVERDIEQVNQNLLVERDIEQVNQTFKAWWKRHPQALPNGELKPCLSGNTQGDTPVNQYYFWMDMRRFDSPRERLTGGEIKEIAGTSSAYPVFKDSFHGASKDTPVGDGELVDVHDGHFYSLIPATRRW